MYAQFSWQGHEGKFSIYVHASKEKPVHVSRYFLNREIRSDEVHILDQICWVMLLSFFLFSFSFDLISCYIGISFHASAFWDQMKSILILQWSLGKYTVIHPLWL